MHDGGPGSYSRRRGVSRLAASVVLTLVLNLVLGRAK